MLIQGEGDIATVLPRISREELRQSQLRDVGIGHVLQAKERGENPPAKNIKGKCLEAKRLVQLWDQLVVKDGLLWRQYEDKDGKHYGLQLVVPFSHRCKIVAKFHSGALGGHLGAEKTHSRIKERFYWPGYWKDSITTARPATIALLGKAHYPKGGPPCSPSEWAIL